MNKNTPTTFRLLGSARVQYVQSLFGSRFVYVESFARDTAASLCDRLHAGRWDYFAVGYSPCQGFYMAPRPPSFLHVVCADGFKYELSATALGIASCLAAYEMLSFSPDVGFARVCQGQSRVLKHFIAGLPEAGLIRVAACTE